VIEVLDIDGHGGLPGKYRKLNGLAMVWPLLGTKPDALEVVAMLILADLQNPCKARCTV
jgi:hypothetical protein